MVLCEIHALYMYTGHSCKFAVPHCLFVFIQCKRKQIHSLLHLNEQQIDVLYSSIQLYHIALTHRCSTRTHTHTHTCARARAHTQTRLYSSHYTQADPAWGIWGKCPPMLPPSPSHPPPTHTFSSQLWSKVVTELSEIKLSITQQVAIGNCNCNFLLLTHLKQTSNQLQGTIAFVTYQAPLKTIIVQQTQR